MDGYLFFGQKLKARLLAPGEVHEELFKGANRVFKKVPGGRAGPAGGRSAGRRAGGQGEYFVRHLIRVPPWYAL